MLFSCVCIFTHRFYFVEDFVAHSSNVSCLALGHQSGHVLVTGGDDKKVNLWAIGKPNCIMVYHHFFYILAINSVYK